MVSRRGFSALGLCALGLSASPLTAAASSAPKARLIIHTFLQAKPQRRADLGEFIRLNWLAMDRQGIDQGIFTHAVLHENNATDPNDVGPRFDYVVEVGYLTEGGYPDVAARFLEIRKKHRTILVNGRALSDLGTIVGERQLRPVASA